MTLEDVMTFDGASRRFEGDEALEARELLDGATHPIGNYITQFKQGPRPVLILAKAAVAHGKPSFWRALDLEVFP